MALFSPSSSLEAKLLPRQGGGARQFLQVAPTQLAAKTRGPPRLRDSLRAPTASCLAASLPASIECVALLACKSPRIASESPRHHRNPTPPAPHAPWLLGRVATLAWHAHHQISVCPSAASGLHHSRLDYDSSCEIAVQRSQTQFRRFLDTARWPKDNPEGGLHLAARRRHLRRSRARPPKNPEIARAALPLFCLHYSASSMSETATGTAAASKCKVQSATAPATAPAPAPAAAPGRRPLHAAAAKAMHRVRSFCRPRTALRLVNHHGSGLVVRCHCERPYCMRTNTHTHAHRSSRHGSVDSAKHETAKSSCCK
ncbi:hypothetical protein L1887_55213 [Cichorium endivia]|nr:hypothetical protein L1887_55213 [Cichorium endivia]